MYLTEWEDFNVSRDHEGLVWNEDLVYGDWMSGPVQDGSRSVSIDVSVPEVYTCMCLLNIGVAVIMPGLQSVQQNGTWYLHVLLVKFGFPLDPEDEDYSEQAITHTTRREGLTLHGLLEILRPHIFLSVQQVPQASLAQYSEPDHRGG